MCKKIGIAAIAVVVGLVVLNKTKLGDWAKYGIHQAKEAFNSSIPPEVEIAKLKHDLASFGPKVHEHLNKMAEDKTNLTKLEKDIEEHTARLADQEKKVLALRQEVDTVKVGSGKSNLKQATLEREWKRFRSAEDGLKAKQRQLEARKAKYLASAEQLDAMMAMQVRLQASIEELEARLEELRVQQSLDTACFDDSKLGDIKEGIAKLSDRISNMENVRDLEAKYTPTIKEGETKKAAVSDDLLKEIDDHFKPASKGGAKVAADRE